MTATTTLCFLYTKVHTSPAGTGDLQGANMLIESGLVGAYPNCFTSLQMALSAKPILSYYPHMSVPPTLLRT